MKDFSIYLIFKITCLFYSRFLYPSLITFLSLTITFPLGTGKYIAGELSVHDQVRTNKLWLYSTILGAFLHNLLIDFFYFKLTGLFSNFTWTKKEFTIEEAEMMNHWRTENTNVFICLSAYIVYNVLLWEKLLYTIALIYVDL